MDLPDGTAFDVRAYLDSQQRATADLAASMPDMHNLIARFHGVSAPHKRYPERTLISYVLQEAEAVSRAAKLRVLEGRPNGEYEVIRGIGERPEWRLCRGFIIRNGQEWRL